MEIKNKIEWTRKHMPVLEEIRKNFSISKPFKGIICGACLHLTKETAMLLCAIQDGGAEIVACASNPLSTQDDVVEYLRSRGMEIHGKKGMTTEEYKLGLVSVLNAQPDYVIDDGADLTEVFHDVGIVYPKAGLEQTTTGVHRIKNMDLKYPILAVNDADTKHLFDNVYGTGQSTIDAIIRATNIMLAGKTFVVCGYGYCGKGLAERARGMGCNVIVTEVDPIKALQARMDGFRVMKIGLAVFEADVVVTVTGSINVLNEDIRDLKNGAIIANSGHFDVEINKKVLIDNAIEINVISDDISEYVLHEFTKVYLLSDGRLVNLSAGEGHPSEVMDMSFSAQILGLKYMVKDRDGIQILDPGVHNMPREIDETIAKSKLIAMGVDFDEETEEQINYRKS